MNILVIGGTGTVGSQVVRGLLAKKTAVSVLTRDLDKGAKMLPGAKMVRGDLLDPGTVRSAFAGVDGVFMLNPVGPTETHEGLMAVNGAMLAGVKRFVYMSVQGLESAPYLPHFGSKIPVEFALSKSGIPYTILRPNNFYQNDYLFKDVMMKYGVYPQPLGGKGTSRVDVCDIAEAAVIALTNSGHEGKTYTLVGPEPLTGVRTAAIWSQALGRPITYGGDDLDAWEKQAAQMMPPWMAFDFRMMYEFFQKDGFGASPADLAVLTKFLGHPPRRFEDFAAETAKMWKS
jgi:uncharacterized protein YbjT (DUF2867 family)